MITSMNWEVTRISDKLWKNNDFIEDQLYTNAKSLFNLNNTVYLYDLTNTYFEGKYEKSKKICYNSNQKEKRNDCKQIVVAK